MYSMYNEIQLSFIIYFLSLVPSLSNYSFDFRGLQGPLRGLRSGWMGLRI